MERSVLRKVNPQTSFWGLKWDNVRVANMFCPIDLTWDDGVFTFDSSCGVFDTTGLGGLVPPTMDMDE